MENTNDIIWYVYARKSSEDKDKQVQSIPDQIERLEEFAARNGMILKKPYYSEEKSAKAPYKRPVFAKMLEDIQKESQKGKVRVGIVTWAFNRLSRNPIESAFLQWMLQEKVIAEIRTYDRTYLPDDNALLINVESGFANQFILDLKKNTQRGIDRKYTLGWKPNLAPIGYKNVGETKGEKTIEVDEVRFDLVRKMWDMMLTGTYTPDQILTIASEEWHLTTIKRRRIGGKPLTRSGIYRMFNNIFYTGLIKKKDGREYEGKHRPMISLEEFATVQQILHRGQDGTEQRGNTTKHEHPFTQMIRCNECGCLYTAETKKKFIKSKGRYEYFTYYHCTRRKKTINCTQRQYITSGDLESQIDAYIKSITILPEFRQWALEIIGRKNDMEIEERQNIYELTDNELKTAQRELDNLTRMRYKEQITEDYYEREKLLLQAKIAKCEEDLRHTQHRAKEWLELTEDAFNFVTYARVHFLTGDIHTKKQILMDLGKNPVVRDGKIVIELNEWLRPIEEGYKSLEERYLRLEPKESLDKGVNEEIDQLCLLWGSRRDTIRTRDYIFKLLESSGKIFIEMNLSGTDRMDLLYAIKFD